MTIPDPRDRAAPSDPRVDAAWRALSDETPPQALDAAILAAARREVGAGPQKIGTPEAMADRRRWWPLAAAATVAAIAVGVLQLTTPDQIGDPASDQAIVSDVPAPASPPARERPTTASRPEETKPDPGNALQAEPAPTRADSPRRQAAAPESRVPAKRESASEKTSALAEPFPAAPPPPTPAGSPAPAAGIGSTAAAGSIGNAAPASQVAMPAVPSEGPLPPATAGIAAAGRAPPAPLAKMAAEHAADARADQARAKDRGPLPVPEWIALIRRLRDEGKSTDTAKELAAFRVAHADHEKLLPPDLRDWRP